MKKAAPVERKVKTTTATSAVVTVVLWALATYVFHGDVPALVQAVVAFVVPAVATFAVGYLTKHTPRAVRRPVVHREPVKVEHPAKVTPRKRVPRSGGYGVLELVVGVLLVLILVFVLLRLAGAA